MITPRHILLSLTNSCPTSHIRKVMLNQASIFMFLLGNPIVFEFRSIRVQFVVHARLEFQDITPSIQTCRIDHACPLRINRYERHSPAADVTRDADPLVQKCSSISAGSNCNPPPTCTTGSFKSWLQALPPETASWSSPSPPPPPGNPCRRPAARRRCRCRRRQAAGRKGGGW